MYMQDFWEVQPIYSELIACLKTARIIHTSEDTAADHINNIFDDPMGWWNLDATKDARNLFNNLCFTEGKNSISLWTNFFNGITNIS